MKLQISNLTKSYGSLSVLNQVNLVLEQEPCYCLMGPSGSGKTTFLRILMGLETADSGTVTLVDKENRALKISAVFQEDRLCESFSPLENVRMALPRSASASELLTEMKKLLPEECLHRPVRTLSGGMKRRTAILRAVLAPSDFLLMDEPFTGLDEELKKHVIHYILENRRGRFLLLSTHQEEDIKLLGGEVLRLN